MLETVRNLNGEINQLEDASGISCRLFIIGATLRAGTRTRYDLQTPMEIVIDKSVQDWLLEIAKKLVSDLLNYELCSINDVDESGEYIKRYIELTNLSELNEWQELIRANSCEPANSLIIREDFKPKSLVCHLIINDSEFFLIKAISETVLLKNKKMLRYLPGRGCYELDQHGNKIFVEDNWDALLLLNNVVMLNENRVLNLFKYYDKFREAAEHAVSEISELGLVSDTQTLFNFVQEQVSFQKKLARATSYPLDNIKKERIQQLINSGTINLNLNDEGQIECTTKEEAKVIIDVLLDNFVSSLITDENYRALNKARLSISQ